MIEIDNVSSLKHRIGQEIGVSYWLEITQERINQFAEATGDHQWIHVDPARAASESPFHATIAHGFLTLSLVSALVRSTITVGRLRMAINYGVNKVRFIAPVTVNSRIRARLVPTVVEETGGAVQVIWGITIERQGQEKPVCVVEWIVRYYLK